MLTRFSVDDQTQALANMLRNDRLWRAKNIDGTKLRKLLIGLALEFGRVENTLDEIDFHYDIEQTERLLEEWESAVGIPDDCFFTTGVTDEQRRNNILTKLTALGVSTKEGFEALAATFGYTVTVSPGADVLVFPYTFPFVLTNANPKWIMVVDISASLIPGSFPLTFPFTFTAGNFTNIIVCLFNKLVPANVKVLYNYV